MTSKKVGPNFWEVPGFSFFSKNYKDIKTVEKLCRPQSGHETPAFDSTNLDNLKPIHTIYKSIHTIYI